MAANATQHRSVRALCEGAIMVALAQILALSLIHIWSSTPSASLARRQRCSSPIGAPTPSGTS